MQQLAIRRSLFFLPKNKVKKVSVVVVVVEMATKEK
jgi:hypothetical protein